MSATAVPHFRTHWKVNIIIPRYTTIIIVLPQSHTPEVNVRIYYANSEDYGTVGAVF